VKGQTTIEPCAVCGEPAETLVEVGTNSVHIPAPGGAAKKLAHFPQKRWLCAAHIETVGRDSGWQRRQREAARKQRVEMQDAQGGLF
jgi:hypothetical protein